MRTRPYLLAVIAFDEMDLLDVAGPLEVFSTAGRKWNWRAVKAELVASRPGALSTRAQLSIGPAAAFASCPEPELVLIPGGYGARLALGDRTLLDYLGGLRPSLTLTLAVGTGALVAARAGLLENMEVATTLALRDELLAIEPTLLPRLDARVVASPLAVTASHSGAALDLGLEVVARLLGKKQASGTAQDLGYDWGTETISVDLKL